MIAGLIALVLIVATLLHCELSNKNSRTNNWLWCKKHGLKLKERIGQECATFWTGEDELGNEYGPGEDGEPVKIRKGGAK